MTTIDTDTGQGQQTAEPMALRSNDLLGPSERAMLNALLDHIYEHGTAAEGVANLAAQLCLTARKEERRRIKAALMAMHERTAHHNYYHCAAVDLFGA